MQHTDDFLLNIFRYYIGNINSIERQYSIDDFRRLMIEEQKHDLLSRMIDIEWEYVLNNQSDMKRLIKLYLLDTNNGTFTFLFNKFINLLNSNEECLYYLNPLNFVGNELLALNLLPIDKSLNYQGLISACKLHGIDTTTFVERLNNR